MVGTATLLLTLAMTALDPAEALAGWGRAIALAPADPRPHLHRGRLLLALCRPAEAREAVEAAATLSGRVVGPVKVLTSVLQAGATDPRTDPLTGAVVPSLMPPAPRPPERLTVWHPDEVLSARADVAMAQGHWADAVTDLADLCSRSADADAQARRGRALLALYRHAEAEAAFALCPDHPAAAAGLAHARAALGKPAADPLPPAARAHQLVLAGDPAAALPHLLEALAAEPRSLELLVLTTRSALEADRPLLAVAACSTALSLPLPADHRADVLTGRATAWLRAGCPPAAERDADRAAALNPFRPGPHDLLGQVAEARADYPAAVGHYAAALERSPGHPHARGRLALLKAVAPDPTVRDPEAAVALADGLPAGPHRDAVLAMGHAAAGRFGRAVLAVNAALGSSAEEDRPQLERMRAAYLRDQAWNGED